MHLFFTPDILRSTELPQEEAQHALKVLRLQEGDAVCATDGKGHLFYALIRILSGKRCSLEVIKKETIPLPWTQPIHIAVSPTKNIDRMEWFTEKSIEIGIDHISFLKCRFSERKELKTERLIKIAIAAMKQSLKYTLPQIDTMEDFNHFIHQDFQGQKFICHCYEADKEALCRIYNPALPALVLIGPEGDFSQQEVQTAIDIGFIPVSLGGSRLRTETAALVACHTLQLLQR